MPRDTEEEPWCRSGLTKLLQVLSSQQSEGRRHCLREKPGGTHLFPSHQQLSPTVSPDTGPSPTQGASRSYSHGFGGPATVSRCPASRNNVSVSNRSRIRRGPGRSPQPQVCREPHYAAQSNPSLYGHRAPHLEGVATRGPPQHHGPSSISCLLSLSFPGRQNSGLAQRLFSQTAHKTQRGEGLGHSHRETKVLAARPPPSGSCPQPRGIKVRTHVCTILDKANQESPDLDHDPELTRT